MMTIATVASLIERQARAWERADPEAIVADFAQDGLFISPGGRWQGREAIRRAAADFFAQAIDIRVTITRLLVDGELGAVEWTWSEHRLKSGQRHTAEDAIIFQIRDDKIVYWREYFDTANF
jgi:uncharacterized protein (TIGR02246 family)